MKNFFIAAGVGRKDLYMTNLLKCMLPGNRKPRQSEIRECSDFLYSEIEIVKPDVLVPLGRYATRHIMLKYGLSLPKPDTEAFGNLYLAKHKKIYPLSHPAFLLYEQSYKNVMIKNYKKIAVLAEECKWFPACPMRQFYLSGRLEGKWIEKYCRGDWQGCTRYDLAEKGVPHPDWMLPDESMDNRLKK